MKFLLLIFVTNDFYQDFCIGHTIKENNKVEFEQVYPERLYSSNRRKKRAEHDTTENNIKHDEYVTFKIPSKKKQFIVDLKKRGAIHSGTIRLIKYDKDGKSNSSDLVPDDCHYHGAVRDHPDSYVYMSTCRGLTGTIDDGDSVYDIEPSDSNGGHKLYHSDGILDVIHEQLMNTKPFMDVNSGNGDDQGSFTRERIKRAATDNVPSLRNFELVNVEPQYIPYLTTNKTRYVEILVSTAPGLYEHYKDEEVILERVLNCFGQVDLSYSAINIRLVVVALEIQQGNEKFERSSVSSVDLGRYEGYVEHEIKNSNDFKDIRFDNAQFFSHTGWDNDVSGFANIGSICSPYFESVSINAWSYNSVTGPSITLMHEFAHNLNIVHDGSYCKCLTPRGCIMRGKKSIRPGFSDCNMKRIAEKELSCINDLPVAPLLSRCGNGIKDVGEECDCGTPENCERNGDHCCQPTDCVLKAHVQCSHFNYPDCCNEQCFYRKQGTLCRESNENCDVEEYCSGESAECPKDHYMKDGTPCDDRPKLLFGTRKGSTLTTTELSHPITAQYFNFTPVQWTKDGWACMKIELLGCQPGQDVDLGTPIKTEDLFYHRAMCVMPKISDCSSVPDGTPIIYKVLPNKYCNYEHTLFIYRLDGTMIHKCSGKKVCPDADGMLILSSACSEDKSRFVRTEKLSLKQNNKCWNAKNGWPKSESAIYLKSGCDDPNYSRTKLNFLETDCIMPYTMDLANEAFTAGGFSLGEEPFRARLKDAYEWCPTTKDKGSWIRINIGKIAKIKRIQVKGSYWNGVTGYHLQYSDDGIIWQSFKEIGTNGQVENSTCYEGKCAKTLDHQCQELWNSDARKADDICWNVLNAITEEEYKGYGTCNPTKNISCDSLHVFCGQLQCRAHEDKPYYIDYGTSYSALNIQTKKCSGAAITNSEQVGLGMVENGVKCGIGKICINKECKTPSAHGVKACIVVDGKECNDQGFCRDDGVCYCKGRLNPEDGCASELVAVDGGWSDWGSWSICTRACGGGETTRFRHCDQPVPKYGGQQCLGQNIDNGDCNTEPCPEGRSCKHIQLKLIKNKIPLYDGIYSITPNPGITLNVYCDMTTDGGGWTLLVSSHTNTWTESNVRFRSENQPSITEDYSILKYSDAIIYSYLIPDLDFEYRLEASRRGHWGGIWKSPKRYKIDSTNMNQDLVLLQKKFGEWNYSDSGIQQRLPYIYKQRLTTSDKPESNFYGSITDNLDQVFPAKWMDGAGMIEEPEHIWYWMREGDYSYPRSCLDLLFRSLNEVQLYKSGIYKIQVKDRVIETYCDLDRYGGGWTLITKSSTTSGWTKENTLERNVNAANNTEYSIFKFVDEIKYFDPAETAFQYMVEADREDQDGGIFSLENDISLLRETPEAATPVLIEKFGNWDADLENLMKYPIHVSSKNGIFLTASFDDTSETDQTNPKPHVIKLWIRESGSRMSCNDIKIHGLHKGKTDYKNGFYMVQNIHPVYCDMEMTKNEGWTLLVTSTTNGWTGDQVLRRNEYQPSLYKDFSVLHMADSIKNLSKNHTFKYMMDAVGRRRWGGIWKAPVEYSFAQSSDDLENVDLIEKFDDWNYEENWYSKPRKRMPYLGRPQMGKALLTTANYDDYFEWGTIIADHSDGRVPAKWIYPEMMSPGVIWYWVNENDCNPDYSKVDGGYSEWSPWSPCSSVCGAGNQSRHQYCNSPVPKCGGAPCGKIISEKRNCVGQQCDENILSSE